MDTKEELLKQIDEQIDQLKQAKQRLTGKDENGLTEVEKNYLKKISNPKKSEIIDGLTDVENNYINKMKQK